MPTTTTLRTRADILKAAIHDCNGRVPFQGRGPDRRVRVDGLFTCPFAADPEKYVPAEATHVRMGRRGRWVALPPRGPSELEISAYHEAGHIAFALAHGWTVSGVHLSPSADGTLALTTARPPAVDQFGPNSANWPVAAVEESIAYLLAGPAAELRFAGRCTGGEHDETRALALAETLVVPVGDSEATAALLARLRAEAVDFVAVRWSAILGLSDAILEAPGRRLAGPELQAKWDRASRKSH